VVCFFLSRQFRIHFVHWRSRFLSGLARAECGGLVVAVAGARSQTVNKKLRQFALSQEKHLQSAASCM
jgi:hypothetical protein